MSNPSSAIQLQLTAVIAQYDELLAASESPEFAIMQEQRAVKRILDELSWQQLPDEAKQKKRKGILYMWDKWSWEQEGAGMDVSYESGVVALYECIEELLRELPPDNPATLRLRCVLLLEKLFINERASFSKMRHFDFYAWQEVMQQSKLDHATLKLDTLENLFHQMYASWPRRPYKEVV